jgi:ribonuclease-3
MPDKFVNLEKNLKIKFKNRDILKTAFIHRSYLNEHSEEKLPHNERLEFLGDAVLGMVVSEYLYRKFPKHPEGDLTNFRSSIVNAKTLSIAASTLKLGGYLYLSRGEEATGGRTRQFILANTFESLIGAIFLDLGLDGAQKFIEKVLLPYLSDIIEKKLYKDYKSKFQEKTQEQTGTTPSYKIMEERGPDHEKTFRTGVFVGSKKIAEGKGPSKQEAEQEAARKALENSYKTS